MKPNPRKIRSKWAKTFDKVRPRSPRGPTYTLDTKPHMAKKVYLKRMRKEHEAWESASLSDMEATA